MNWVSHVGRRILQAYSEGLVMSCPLHRLMDEHNSGDSHGSGVMPAAINRSQADVGAALRPQFASHQPAQAISSVRH